MSDNAQIDVTSLMSDAGLFNIQQEAFVCAFEMWSKSGCRPPVKRVVAEMIRRFPDKDISPATVGKGVAKLNKALANYVFFSPRGRNRH